MKRFVPYLLLFCASCSTPTKIITMQSILDPYLNSTEKEIKLVWGAPVRETPDGGGGKIIVYESTGSVSTGYYYNQKLIIPNTYIRRSDHYTVNKVSYVQFYIDSAGKVYYYNTNFPDRIQRDPQEQWNAAEVFGAICAAAIATFLIASFTKEQ